MQLPIVIGLHRSLFLDVLVLINAVLALGVAFICFTIPVFSLFVGFVVATGYLGFKSQRSALMALRLEASGQISVMQRGDTEFGLVELLPNATVHPWMSVLHFRLSSGEIRSLVLVVGKVRGLDFRRLRVFLRWRAEFSDSPFGA
ncbi:MAG: hypothetical protein D3M94_10345 [Rhodocyclales bacterium GT-UBC]|nr:MAG: hypothetical protein D3M94_10345 [Rhodocyclales bacterium GT-UBC]